MLKNIFFKLKILLNKLLSINFTNLIVRALYCWYIYSWIVTPIDYWTTGNLIYLIGEIINTMCLALLWDMLQPKIKVTILYNMIDIILIAWFFYYSWIDAANPIIWEKVIYTGVDVLSLATFFTFFIDNILTNLIVKYFGQYIKNNIRYIIAQISSLYYFFMIISHI